jgi:F-type H+-transporting ATPase subunit b
MNQFKGIPGGDNLHGSTQEHGGASAPNPLVQLDPGLFFWTILTFVLISFVLSKFAWKPLLLALKEREDQINESLDNAENARVELEKINSESEVIISKARSEALGIHSEAKMTAEKVKSDLLEKANLDIKKLKETSEQQIRIEKEKAISEIRKEVVGLSLMIAEKLIKKNLSKSDNETLIKETINNLKTHEA